MSAKTSQHCASKFSIPVATTDPEVLFQDKQIDLILVLTSDEYHAPYTIAALQAGKSVMVEKPITLSLQSAQAILDAEKAAPGGARVFVGYMRRFAPSLKAFLREMASIRSIKYARVRDIIGPNSYFIGQSGCYPEKYFHDVPESARQDRQTRLSALLAEAWGDSFGNLSPAQLDYCCLLANLGSHGLGVMREVLGGLPEKVLASTDNARWYTTMLAYKNRNAPHEPFTCLYETGIDEVPRFDSHITVYGQSKTVSICYDTLFVKGLGITVEIDEMNEHGEKVHRSVQTSYEDAYTSELIELHDCIAGGRPTKTTALDAVEDLKIFKMMMDAYPAEKRGSQSQTENTSFLPSGP